MSYQLSPAGVVRLADGAVIPGDPTNAAWQAYQAWVDGGNIPAPAMNATVAKAAKWDAVKAERDRRTQAGGYKAGGKWFHSDQFSRGQQLGLVLLGANIPANLQWKTMDGSFVAMTPVLAQQVLGAAAASDQAIFAAAEIHKAAMEASPSPADYDFSAGWPLVFGG